VKAFAIEILATGHQTKVRNSDNRDGISESELSLKKVPTEAKQAQITAVRTVNLVRELVGDNVFCQGNQPEIEQTHCQCQAG
jgi:hypothetical protein